MPASEASHAQRTADEERKNGARGRPQRRRRATPRLRCVPARSRRSSGARAAHRATGRRCTGACAARLRRSCRSTPPAGRARARAPAGTARARPAGAAPAAPRRETRAAVRFARHNSATAAALRNSGPRRWPRRPRGAACRQRGTRSVKSEDHQEDGRSRRIAAVSLVSDDATYSSVAHAQGKTMRVTRVCVPQMFGFFFAIRSPGSAGRLSRRRAGQRLSLRVQGREAASGKANAVPAAVPASLFSLFGSSLVAAWSPSDSCARSAIHHQGDGCGCCPSSLCEMQLTRGRCFSFTRAGQRPVPLPAARRRARLQPHRLQPVRTLRRCSGGIPFFYHFDSVIFSPPRLPSHAYWDGAAGCLLVATPRTDDQFDIGLDPAQVASAAALLDGPFPAGVFAAVVSLDQLTDAPATTVAYWLAEGAELSRRRVLRGSQAPRLRRVIVPRLRLTRMPLAGWRTRSPCRWTWRWGRLCSTRARPCGRSTRYVPLLGPTYVRSRAVLSSALLVALFCLPLCAVVRIFTCAFLSLCPFLILSSKPFFHFPHPHTSTLPGDGSSHHRDAAGAGRRAQCVPPPGARVALSSSPPLRLIHTSSSLPQWPPF